MLESPFCDIIKEIVVNLRFLLLSQSTKVSTAPQKKNI